ncbi:ABC transporter ATP-binding protein [Pararhizobium sp. LjRoot255]|uniref:ABC transporter ATP-binding protein n=1 Tax=Pararhizobium sp. LjRoot255 TaxID=3342298 RepID=UPI003ED1164A
MTSADILQVRDLRLGYGRKMVLHGVSFEVPVRGLVAIVGPNGAGKSSTLGAVAGGNSLASGSITFEGENISGASPEVISAKGIAFVPEGRHVFASLTVEENLRSGTFRRKDRGAVEGDLERVLQYFPRLRERLRQPGGKMSGGEQQMLVIGRALMCRPRLMLIDEPSLGLAPKVVEEVYETFLRLRAEEGLSILVNEQSSRRVMRYADEIMVLRDGIVQIRGTPSTLTASALHDAYFGAGTFESGKAE